MLERGSTFFAGLLIGFLSAGLLWLLVAEPRGQPVILHAPPTPGPIRVHVSGEVADPGVYALNRNAIVQAAIKAAGGATSEAELNQINLAAKLHDGQQVFVPPANAEPDHVSALNEASVLNAGPTSPGRININQAGASELELLPGIGPSLAGKIIEYREENGPFETPEELMDVAGIGPAKLEELFDWIRLD